MVLGPLRHLGTLFLEGPQGLVPPPHLPSHFSSPGSAASGCRSTTTYVPTYIHTGWHHKGSYYAAPCPLISHRRLLPPAVATRRHSSPLRPVCLISSQSGTHLLRALWRRIHLLCPAATHAATHSSPVPCGDAPSPVPCGDAPSPVPYGDAPISCVLRRRPIFCALRRRTHLLRALRRRTHLLCPAATHHLLCPTATVPTTFSRSHERRTAGKYGEKMEHNRRTGPSGRSSPTRHPGPLPSSFLLLLLTLPAPLRRTVPARRESMRVAMVTAYNCDGGRPGGGWWPGGRGGWAGRAGRSQAREAARNGGGGGRGHRGAQHSATSDTMVARVKKWGSKRQIILCVSYKR